MLPLLGRLLPPDPPQKWITMKEAALADDASTHRLIKLMLVNCLPVLLICAALLAIAALVVFR